MKGAERSEYRHELEAMHASVDAGEAALVLFHPHSLRPELPPLDELIGRAAIRPWWRPTV